MNALNFTVKLISDAMPSSGLGTELIDSLITRNLEGYPLIRGSHIKGVMRQTLSDTVSVLGFPDLNLVKNIFGSSPDKETDYPGICSLSDCIVNGKAESIFVTRTAVNEHGVAEKGSLRSNEMLSAGSLLSGRCYFDAEKDSPEDLGLRFSLLAMDAIGGSRSRGAGQCLVSIEGEERTAGDILTQLNEFLRNGIAEHEYMNVHYSGKEFPPEEYVLYEVEFITDSPVCCPETPVKTNLITSGFSIPASAVQGAILHKLNGRDPELASACFNSASFRPWPLQPLPEGASGSVRVSLTHKVDKNAAVISDQLKKMFFDEAIQEDWREKAKGAPLKSSDGVLLVYNDSVKLWKSSSMPRVVSIHNSVHSDTGGLFSMESMAPGRWIGIVAIPSEAAGTLESIVSTDKHVSFGKRRSVQGGGDLHLERINELPMSSQSSADTYFITQSPVLLDYSSGESIEKAFLSIVEDWADANNLTSPVKVWADAGLRFGWNRHKLGNTIGENSRLQAEVVVLPGSVIKLQGTNDRRHIEKALVSGLGSGRQRGYGAVIQHPGIASCLFQSERQLSEVSSGRKSAIKEAIRISKNFSLPTASQIGALKTELEDNGVSGALNYLERQRLRGKKYWSHWEDIHDVLKSVLQYEGAESALQYIINESVALRKDEA